MSEEAEVGSLSGKSEEVKQRKFKQGVKSRKIIINLSDCQYPVVAKVAKHFNWKIQRDPEGADWDVFWTDNAVQPWTLVKMEQHQKINHFPGMFNLSRKNLMARGLMRMRKRFPQQYDFFPLTWLLPSEGHELRAYFDSRQKGKARTFIVKPEAMSQGKGIYLTRKLQDIDLTSHCVVQRYLHRPYLIEGLKFDLRVYVLLASVDPLRVYLYQEGLARFATETYEAPTRDNIHDTCMHLTNYAINKDNPKFVFNCSEKDMTKGHKRSLTSVLEIMRSSGVDVNSLMQKVKQSIVKTLISGLPALTSSYRSCQPDNFSSNMCFELLGFDVMVTDKAEPVILEINYTPSFTTDTPLDHHIKFNYIKDSLTLMNINSKLRQQLIRVRKEVCQQRVMTGKKVRLTQEERDAIKAKQNDKKNRYQQSHRGGFELIYPNEALHEQYSEFITHAELIYSQSIGGNRKIQKSEIIEAKTPKPSTMSVPKTTINPNRLQKHAYSTKSIEGHSVVNVPVAPKFNKTSHQFSEGAEIADKNGASLNEQKSPPSQNAIMLHEWRTRPQFRKNTEFVTSSHPNSVLSTWEFSATSTHCINREGVHEERGTLNPRRTDDSFKSTAKSKEVRNRVRVEPHPKSAKQVPFGREKRQIALKTLLIDRLDSNKYEVNANLKRHMLNYKQGQE